MAPSPVITLRKNPTAAHVLPLAVFMTLNLVPGWLRIENSMLPWYLRAPEQWVFPFQTLLCGGLLIAFRQNYKFAPRRSFFLATCLAGFGTVLWIAPVWLNSWFNANGEAVPGILRWLGVTDRTNGFDPTILANFRGGEAAAVSMRILRMVIVVPLVEEIFWRGFLMRYLAAEGGRWEDVPFGTHRWKIFFIVTILVMLAHKPEDYAAALVWGALVYFLTIRTKSLGACVVMHAVANLLLGVYIMKTGSWGMW